MKAKTVPMFILAWTCAGIATVGAQTPIYKSPLETAPPPGVTSDGITSGIPVGPVAGAPHQLSSWITGDKYACCAPGTGGTPIFTEVFFRTGPAFTFGDGHLAEVLDTGINLGAGARTLFFDPCMTSAWTVELSLSTVWNNASGAAGDNPVALNILVPQNPANPVTPPDATGNLPPQRVFFGRNGVPGVTVKSLNRTFFNVGGGREWYLWGAPNCQCNTWRVGCDVGGRYGSSMVRFQEIKHRTDVVGGMWAAVHTDLEIPLSGCCVFQTGVRLEYDYIWSDILQIQNKSDTQDINILFSVGLRY